ncbi:MAG: TonB-dependent receptor [candidate division Zixibacteria bacterium]|nr:TonB-dependent receptor [candidate division Zixibacteria bacterium]
MIVFYKNIIFIIIIIVVLTSVCFADEPVVIDSMETDSLNIPAINSTQTDTISTDSVQIKHKVEIPVPFEPRFMKSIEDDFSSSRKLNPATQLIRAREFSDILVGESFLPVIIGPPGQSRTVILNSDPSMSPYVQYNGGIVPESYWMLPHFRGPELNSLPTESLKSVALLDGAAVIAGGYNPGPGIIDIRNLPMENSADSSDKPFTNVSVLRGPEKYHKTGITISKNGPYNSRIRAIVGLVSSIGYLPRSEYEAHYYGVTAGFRMGRYPVEVSGYRYRGRGEYTILDYLLQQNAEYSRDLISLSAKTVLDFSADASLSINTFINRRPHTALDNSLGIHYRTINTIGGGSADYERQYNRHLIHISLKSWYEKLDCDDLYNPDMIRSSLSFGDIYNLTENLNLLFLGRYDYSDETDSDISGVGGLNLRLTEGLTFYSTIYRQSIFPDLHSIYWPPESYPDGFDIGGFTYKEQGNLYLPVGVRNTIEGGAKFNWGLISVRGGVSYSECEDIIRYTYDGTPTNLVYAPEAVDYTLYSAYSNARVSGLFDILHIDTGVRFSDISYDDDYLYYFEPSYRLYAGGLFKRELFIRKMIFRAGVEIDFTDSRYIPGFIPRFEEYYWLVNSTLSVTYKDLTFYYNGENISDQIYYSNGDNPVLGRVYWWGLSWNFSY